MAVRRNYRINLRNYGNPPAIMVSQYDENYDLVFEVFDGVVPATGLNAYTVKLVGRQPGEDPALKYEFTGTVSGTANNILSFTIDTTMTGKAGKGTAEIVILDTTNDVKFASFNLPVYVEKAAVPDDAIDADVERAQEIADEVAEIVDGATEGAEAWAVGQRGGVDVENTDPTYHNNAKYYAEYISGVTDQVATNTSDISDLKEDLNATIGMYKKQFDWAKLATSAYPTGWRQGLYGKTTGGINNTSTGAIRNVSTNAHYLSEYSAFTVYPPSGCEVWVCEYDNFDTFNENHYIKTWDGVVEDNPVTVIVTEGHGYGITIRNRNTEISPTEEFVAQVVMYQYIPMMQEVNGLKTYTDNIAETLNEKIDILSNVPEWEWTYNKMVSSSGAISNSDYYAITQIVDCQEGDVFYNHTAGRDALSGFSYYHVLYKTTTVKNDTFYQRIGASSTRKMSIPEDVTGYRFMFGRSTSGGVQISEGDIDNVDLEVLRKGTPNDIDTHIKVLCIGNSFSQDSVSYMPYILRGLANNVKLTLGISYVGGAGIDDYITLFGNDSATVTFNKLPYNSDAWINTANQTFKSILEAEDWDVVTFQQKSTEQEDWTHFGTLNTLIDDVVGYLATTHGKSVRVGWLMPQIRLNGSTASSYANMIECVKKVLETTPCSFVIPCGTAIQLARQNDTIKDLGDGGGLTKDGAHLQEGLPCLISAYVTTIKVLGFIGLEYKSILGEQTRPTQEWITAKAIPGQNGTSVGVTDANCYIAQQIATEAIKNPYGDDDVAALKEDLNSIRSNPINLFEMKGLTPNGTKTDVTISGNSFTVATNQSAQYSGVYKYIDLEPNTTYCISCIGTKNLDTSVISAYYAESTDGGETYPSSSQALFSNRASGKRYITYFTTTTGKVRLAFYCTTSTTASGSVTYSDIILTKGNDYYGYFVPAGGAVDASANRLSEMVFSKLAQGFGREFTQADVTQASTTRLNISNLSVTDGDILVFHRGTNSIEMLVECYNGSTFVKQFDYVKGTNHLLIDHTGTIKIVLRKEGNATIAVSDYDAQITLISGFNVKDYVDTSVSDAVTETKDYTDSAISDALTNIDDAELIPASSIIQGAYVRDGSVQTNSKRIRTAGLLDINIGDKIIFKSGTVATGILCGFINDFMSVKETAWVYTDTEITSTTTGKLVIMFRNTDNTAITPNDYDAVTKIKRAKQFYSGMSKYNGSVFRLNYAEAIPYPVRNSNTYSVTYANFIYEYTKLINRITTLYSDVSDLVPKPITAVKETLRTAGSYDIVKITFTPAYPKKRIFMIAGTHGNEYESIYGLLNFVKALYAERYTYPQLTDFRNDVELVIIPCVNPYGFEHNTKLNADGLNIYNYYSVTDDTQPMEMRAIKDVFSAGGLHYFLDMHTDPYNSTSQKGCYVYAYIDSATFPHAYNLTMRYREILYDEFGYSAKFLSSDKDVIVGRIDNINSSAGIAYAERRSIPANLAEISTGYGWGGSGESGADPAFPSFAPYGSADMVRICTEWYANVVLTMYKNLLVA